MYLEKSVCEKILTQYSLTKKKKRIILTINVLTLNNHTVWINCKKKISQYCYFYEKCYLNTLTWKISMNLMFFISYEENIAKTRQTLNRYHRLSFERTLCWLFYFLVVFLFGFDGISNLMCLLYTKTFFIVISLGRTFFLILFSKYFFFYIASPLRMWPIMTLYNFRLFCFTK